MKDEYICKQDAAGVIEKEMENYVSDIWYKSATHSALNDVNEDIKSLEPADVVQVVRCENCVHWSDSNHCARPELSGSRWHDAKYFETMPDDFCSYGERREE